MEKELNMLFDYQKFSKNKKVESVINDVNKQLNKLSDADLENIVAAGAVYNMGHDIEKNNNDGNKKDN